MAAGLAISIFSRRRWSVSYVLLHDGWPAPYGHWRFACVYENRELSYDGGDEAEMYVSCCCFFTRSLVRNTFLNLVWEKQTGFNFTANHHTRCFVKGRQR